MSHSCQGADGFELIFLHFVVEMYAEDDPDGVRDNVDRVLHLNSFFAWCRLEFCSL